MNIRLTLRSIEVNGVVDECWPNEKNVYLLALLY